MREKAARALGAKLQDLLPDAADEILRGARKTFTKWKIEDFLTGGCYIFARAFREWAGPKAEVLGVWWVDYDFEDALDHIVVRIDDWFFDQNGASTERELLQWSTVGFYRSDIEDPNEIEIEEKGGRLIARIPLDPDFAVWLSPFSKRDVESQGVACPIVNVNRLRKLLARELGSPSDWGIEGRRSQRRERFEPGRWADWVRP